MKLGLGSVLALSQARWIYTETVLWYVVIILLFSRFPFQFAPFVRLLTSLSTHMAGAYKVGIKSTCMNQRTADYRVVVISHHFWVLVLYPSWWLSHECRCCRAGCWDASNKIRVGACQIKMEKTENRWFVILQMWLVTGQSYTHFHQLFSRLLGVICNSSCLCDLTQNATWIRQHSSWLAEASFFTIQ